MGSKSNTGVYTVNTNVVARLTPREEQVFALILFGRCNKEIASELGISPRTVKFHVSHLLEKFKVTTRMELLSLWSRRSAG